MAKVAKSKEKSSATDEAFILRASMRPIYALRRPRLCGLIACQLDAGVTVSAGRDGRDAHYHGVMTCNSVHACAPCSGRIRVEKRGKIEKALRLAAMGVRQCNRLRTWTDRKGKPRSARCGAVSTGPRCWECGEEFGDATAANVQIRMLTWTVRHDGSESLLSLRKGVLGAFRRMRKNGTVQRLWKKRVFATVRSIEVTHGAHGWHPHLHLVILTTEWTDEEMATLERAWNDAVLDELGEQAEPEPGIGLRWTDQRPNTAYYLSKLGLEMTHVQAKRARGVTSRNQWDIARDAVDGDERSIALWREYETAMKGVRCIE